MSSVAVTRVETPVAWKPRAPGSEETTSIVVRLRGARDRVRVWVPAPSTEYVTVARRLEPVPGEDARIVEVSRADAPVQQVVSWSRPSR